MKTKDWLLPYLKENKRMLGFVIFFGVLTIFSAALLMFTSGFLISKAATRPENLLMIYVPIVAVRTFGITRAVSRYIERLVGHDVVLRIVTKMRLRVYQLVEPNVLSSFAKKKTGEVLGILAEDIERLQDLYLKTIFPMLATLLMYGLSIAALGWFSWPFALLMAFYAGVLLLLFPLVSLLVTKAKVQAMKAGRHRLYERLTDAVMGISDWQFSGRQHDFIQEYEREEEALSQDERQRMRFVRWRNTAAQGVIALMVVSMLRWTAEQTARGELAPVMIAAFVLVIFPLTEAFLPISDALSEIPAYQDSFGRLSRLAKDQKEPKISLHQDIPRIAAGGGVTLELRHVSFQYDHTEQTLDDISFTIRPGEKLALLGPSGAGKSTILKLIEGAVSPTAGQVVLNGVPTTSLGIDIAKWVAVLNQKPHLFDTTIRNNIRLGREDATDEEIVWAAKQVKLHDYIQSLPLGYDTPLLETGVRFSGGQRQRIALARILLQDAPIVVLDEPTIGLDPMTEKELMLTIFEVLKDKSVLWITHHLAFVHMVDAVLFLDRGKLQLHGTHEQLLKTSERYKRLYAMR
ncbi:thiol reductant ABC exporter subunit CydC [Anoxybacillus rupiensis]|uniref:thiol reductant ABC exporter subunit CydC n=1 Tax=Anoxybacteroides rupiense TaxID=311460 RepID=UPI001BA77F81|nr:thiol reductant ABC exporter subunit CydC [Anoxybacillus rupiensis]MBS2771166.1 thiol reductant ABC exporter subunit CydC [Anoxybacillus rupiensis]